MSDRLKLYLRKIDKPDKHKGLLFKAIRQLWKQWGLEKLKFWKGRNPGEAANVSLATFALQCLLVWYRESWQWKFGLDRGSHWGIAKLGDFLMAFWFCSAEREREQKKRLEALQTHRLCPPQEICWVLKVLWSLIPKGDLL